MHKPMDTYTTLLVAVFATAAATAYALYLTYETHATIDAVAVPAHYLELEQARR
jgi:hypothetical protein